MKERPPYHKALTLLPYVLIILGSISAFLPFLITDTWFKSHDGPRYIFLFSEFKETFLHGQIYPRWHANMYGGYGYPSFCFYQPGYFYLLLIISLFVKKIFYLFCASFIILFSLGGIGAYKLCRHFSGRFSSFFMAILFLLTPYIYVNLFVRGDLSELAAMLLTPWPFFLLLSARKKYERQKPSGLTIDMILFALSLFFIIISHPATALFVVPVVFVLALTLCLQGRRVNFKLFQNYLAGFALSVILSSPYWATLFLLKEHVSIAGMSHYFTSPQDHVVYWKQFFSTQWAFTYSNPGPVDGMSYQLGIIHFFLSLTGFLLCRKNKLIAVSFALYCFLIFLMSPLSVWVWKKAPFISYIQFPWRILSITAVLQLICLCGFGPAFKNRTVLLRVFLVLMVGLTAAVHRKQFTFIYGSLDAQTALDSYQKLRLFKFTGLNAENEFLPKYSNLKKLRSARGNLPMVLMAGRETLKPLPENNPYHIRYAFSSREPGLLLINQFYFPGWKVKINGEVVADDRIRKNLSPAGLMALRTVPGQNQTVEAYYDGPPYRRIRTFVVVLLSIMLLVYLKRINTIKPPA